MYFILVSVVRNGRAIIKVSYPTLILSYVNYSMLLVRWERWLNYLVSHLMKENVDEKHEFSNKNERSEK